MIAYFLAAASVTVTSLPARPYAEIVDNGFALNGDLIINNGSKVEQELFKIRVDAFDKAGRLLQRKEINDNGSAPSIELVNHRKIKAGEDALIFNPAAVFPLRASPERVDYTLFFEGADKSRETITVTLRPRPASPQIHSFPLRGRILIWDGHDFLSHHRRVDLMHPILKAEGWKHNAMRYSFDMIIVQPDGSRSTGDEKDNRNWYSFGVPVHSVGGGVVSSIRSDQADNRTFNEADAGKPNGLGGNFVIVKETDGRYSMYMHLQQGSVAVKVGQKVVAGQMLGRIGASGDSLFPHLHYQRMEGPNTFSEGVPTRFKGVIRPDGSTLVKGYVDSGDIVIAK